MSTEHSMREMVEALQARFEKDAMAYHDRYLRFTDWHWKKKAEDAKKWRDVFSQLNEQCKAALAKPEGEWLNGHDYEYEFAYCSECGRTQWADWNSHDEAKERIGKFHEDYRFCPGCGAKMAGGRYVE